MTATVATSPLLGPNPDITPRPYCVYSTKGTVWFLAESVDPVPAVRECWLPPGSSVFFPVVWAFWVRDFPGQIPYNESKARVEEVAGAVESMFLEIDGTPVSDLTARWFSPPAFTIVSPEDNIYGVPAKRWEPVASRGVWVNIGPLTPGRHTIRYGFAVKDGPRYDTSFALHVSE